MTKEEIKQEMAKGVKVTHIYFQPNEWATMQNGLILLEDGVTCDEHEFWNHRKQSFFDNGWSVWNGETPKPKKVYHTPIEVKAICKNGSEKFGANASCKYWYGTKRTTFGMDVEIFGSSKDMAISKLKVFLESNGLFEREEVNYSDI